MWGFLSKKGNKGISNHLQFPERSPPWLPPQRKMKARNHLGFRAIEINAAISDALPRSGLVQPEIHSQKIPS